MNEFMEFFNNSDPTNVSTSVKLVLLMTVLSLAPSILILMTCFTRIIIVLSFVRTSLATQQMPPNGRLGTFHDIFHNGTDFSGSE